MNLPFISNPYECEWSAVDAVLLLPIKVPMDQPNDSRIFFNPNDKHQLDAKTWRECLDLSRGVYVGSELERVQGEIFAYRAAVGKPWDATKTAVNSDSSDHPSSVTTNVDLTNSNNVASSQKRDTKKKHRKRSDSAEEQSTLEFVVCANGKEHKIPFPSYASEDVQVSIMSKHIGDSLGLSKLGIKNAKMRIWNSRNKDKCKSNSGQPLSNNVSENKVKRKHPIN